MKAIVISRPGEPEVLQLAERTIPFCGPDEVLIKVAAAGVNRPDVFQRKGHYPAPPGAPEDIPGLEVSGIIETCGEGVTRWQPGDAVCVLIAGGGYSQYVTAHASVCLPVPNGLSFIEAAALPETVFTVWHNVFQRGKLKKGESLLVHGGSSGIGTTAIQLATALGSAVYATAGTNEKCKAAENLGAVKCVNYKKADFYNELRSVGIDVILDMIGGDYTDRNIRLLKEEGRLVHINAIRGSKVQIDISEIMRRRLTITGSTLRARDLRFKSALAQDILENVWPLLERNRLKPLVYKTFPLSDAASAHSLMEESSHIGKLVLSVDDTLAIR
ncbi:NAD(P)H-quinone oxidoreductase [Arcticibacter sp.]|uniref:NAD(P)H-quinone oxidoreductase n=1 Tax=Arcticibacter sp. TaxID=1872630 RepID=UPI00388D6292